MPQSLLDSVRIDGLGRREPSGDPVLAAVIAQRGRDARLIVLFSATLFLSAFLLFVVQPMIARMLLPQLGGAAAVWTTCLVFFQTVLLGGYAYAHGAMALLGVRRHIWPHVIVVLLPLLVLPIHLADSVPRPGANPVPWLLLTLVTSIGLPFFVLSTSAAVLQKWYSSTDDERASDPYFLYAASNLGSFAALVAYPILIAPTLRLQEQVRWWTLGYMGFGLLVVTCAAVVWRQRGTTHEAPAASADHEVLTWRRRLRWTGLAFIPSSLLLGVTTHISTDIAAVPLLWVLPLSLYLLTFIVAFSPTAARVRALAGRLMPVVLVPLALFLVAQFTQPLTMVIPFHLLAFTLIALVCHGELAADRPSRTHLTELYLWMSVGGTLGGLFNAVVAPVLFTGIAEYPLVVALSCLVVPAALRDTSKRRRALDVALPLIVAALAIGSVMANNRLGSQVRMLMIGATVPAVLAFSQRRHPMRFAACVGALLVSGAFVQGQFGQQLYAVRTFFGVYRVSNNARAHYRMIAHGTTIHGMQSTLPERRVEPLSYFHRTGPIGQVFASVPAASTTGEIAVAGLGAGSLASYRSPGQRWTFFEIDPVVERLARDQSSFTYLADCGSHCTVVIGDARLSLARTAPNQFRMIILDTFSSDAIPVHLLTREALALYLSKLAPGGVIAVHVSNKHVAVNAVTARLAQDAELVALLQFDPGGSDSTTLGKFPSEWVVLARRREDLGALADDPRWITPAVPSATPLWTDDFSNIVSVLKHEESGPAPRR